MFQPVEDMVEYMVECIQSAQDNGPFMLKLSAPIVLFLFFFGCIILPLLLKNLRGHSKLYMILQQVSIVFCVTLVFVVQIVDDRLRTDLHKQFSEPGMPEVKHWIIIIACSAIFKQFFFYQYHAFTFLQCTHYRSMICDPLRFKEFSASKKVAERIAIALVISSLLLLDDIAQITAGRKPIKSEEDRVQMDNLVFKISYYSLAELSLFKLLYIGALVKMSYDIRKSLSQAEVVRDDHATRRPLYYVVALIPLINGIICSVTDITTAAISVFFKSSLIKLECDTAKEGFNRMVQIPVVASFYLLTSIISTCGYLKYFPKLRICCRKTE